MSDLSDPKLREILMQAAALPAEQRQPMLEKACGDDRELRREIESLLEALQQSADFLERPTLRQNAASLTVPAVGEGPGTRMGHYKLLQQIGEGGMGIVFMADQERPVKRRVAVKIIKPGMDSRQVIARFEAERQALAMMDHPHIARVFDAGTTETGRPYFVMELVHGVPITTFCDANKLTTRQRLELFLPVCSALQHAHQKGIIHRDLKPGNVLVTMHDDKPVPKIIDFGVAKAINQSLTEHTLFTEFRQLIGTPAYMSPEQAQISGLDMDTRSDIYSLGVLLYELLTGTTPFDAKELRAAAYEEIQRIIREVEPPKASTRLSTLAAGVQSAVADQRRCNPATLSRTLQGDLDWIMMKCLEKDRSRRYETANGLAHDIQRHLNDEPVEASPPTAAYRVRKFARKHRLSLSIGTAFAAVLVVATIISSWQALQATRAKSIALAAGKRADEEARAATSARLAAELNLTDALIAQADALGADGQWRAAKETYRRAIDTLRANGESPFLAELALWEANRRSPSALLEISAHHGEVTHIRFFPDGKQLASIGQDGVAHIWETLTGRMVRTISGLGEVQRLSVSSNGGLIAFASTSGGVTVWKTTDGTMLRAIGGFAGRASAVSFSPDAKFLAIGIADPPYELLLFNADSGVLIHKFSGHLCAIRDVAFAPDGLKVLSCDGRPPDDTMGWGYKPTLRAWDVRTGTLLWSVRADTEDRLIGQLSVSETGDSVASTSWDGDAKLWDIASGKLLRTTPSVKGHEVQGVACFADGVVAVGGPTGSIRISVAPKPGGNDLGPTSGLPHRQFAGHIGEARTLDFSHDGRLLASGGSDGIIRIWPVYAGGEARIFPDFEPGKPPPEMGRVTLSPDARLALSHEDGLIRLWDVESGTEINRLNGSEATFAHDGQRIVVVEKDGWIGIWDNNLRHRVGRFFPPGGRSFNGIAISPDSRTLVAAFGDGDDVAVYELPTERIVARLAFPLNPTTEEASTGTWKRWVAAGRELHFSPDGTVLAGSSSRANLLKIWRTADWREVHTASMPRPTHVAISPDSRKVACRGADVRVFDAQSGRLLNQFADVPDSFGAVGFLPDSHYLISLGAPPDGLILWDLAKNSRIRSFSVGTFVFNLAISTNGTLLWSLRTARGTLNVAHLDWVAEYDRFVSKLTSIQPRLQAERSHKDALTTLAEWYAFRGMPDCAIDLLNRAGQPAAEKHLLEICRKQVIAEDWGYRRNETLSRVIDRALEDDPTNGALLTALVSRYAGAGRFGEARADFKKAIDTVSNQLSNLTVDTGTQESIWSQAQLYAQRGGLYGRTGLFQEAAADFARVVELSPDNDHYWHEGLMPLLLALGQMQEFHKRLDRELEQFKATQDWRTAHRVAKDALSLPVEGEELKLGAELAEWSMSLNSQSWEGRQTKGMAEYRLGHYHEAIFWMYECRRTVAEHDHKTVADLFTAMSQERLGNLAAAQAALAWAVHTIETECPKPGEDNFVNAQDWLLSQSLRREAEALIGTVAPAAQPTSAASLPPGLEWKQLRPLIESIGIPAKTRDILTSPSDARLLAERGELYARLGRFQEAANDFAEAIELEPDNHHYWHDGLMPLLIGLGRIDEYHKRLDRELRQFNATQDGLTAHRVAKDALALPVEGEELKLGTDLAERAVGLLSDSSPKWAGCQTKGMAEYRGGHYKEAVQWMTESRELLDSDNKQTEDDLFTAMSYEHLGDHVAAQAALQRAVHTMETKCPKAGEEDFTAFADWLLCQSLRREAEALL